MILLPLPLVSLHLIVLCLPGSMEKSQDVDLLRSDGLHLVASCS